MIYTLTQSPQGYDNFFNFIQRYHPLETLFFHDEDNDFMVLKSWQIPLQSNEPDQWHKLRAGQVIASEK